MEKKFKKIENKNAKKILDILSKTYSDAKCSLDFTTPFSLTVALILAAQNTDKNVNEVTPIFFKKFKTIKDVANASEEEIQTVIKSCGFYKVKAKHIKSTANMLLNCEFPNTMEKLTKLAGIGRKSANILMQECFNNPVGIAVDTHVTRLSYRIGLSKEINPNKIENDLINIFKKEDYKNINHVFVYHGRAICTARNPKCDECPINTLCKKNER